MQFSNTVNFQDVVVFLNFMEYLNTFTSHQRQQHRRTHTCHLVLMT